jgi:hypothetical protein
VARLAAALALGTALLAGCGDGGSDVDCNLNACTVTLDRGVDAQASILGVDVKLVGVESSQVTLDVEGNQVTVPVGDNSGTDVAGVNVAVESVTADKVVLRVTQQQ